MEQTTTKWYPSKWMVLFLIWVAYFLNQADRQAFNVVLPLIQEDLGLAASEMGMIASILTFFFAMMVPLGGWLGDLVSRKWLLSLCIIFWSVATMFTGVATSFVTLVLIRCISMGGEAIFGPNYLPMLSEYHSKTRAIAMALVQVAYYLGIIASGWLAGYIGQTYGWKATFIVFGAVGLLHGLLMVAFLRDKRKLATENAAQSTPAKKVSLLDGFRIIFTTPTVLFVMVGFAGLLFVVAGYLTWMPAYLHENFQMQLSDAGFHSMLWTHCFAAVGVLLAGRLADMFGTKHLEWRMYLQGIGLIAAVPFIMLMGNATEMWLVCVGLAGFGFFRAFFDANTYVVVYDVIPAKYYSSCTGALCMMAWAVGSLSPMVLGFIKQYASLSTGLSILGCVWLVCGVIVLLGSKLFYRRDYERQQQLIARGE